MPRRYRFSPTCCCGCVLIDDDFERADSATVGNGWTEFAAGDWSISGGALQSSAGSLLRYVYRDFGTPFVRIYADLVWDSYDVGDEILIVFNRVDAFTYHAVKIVVSEYDYGAPIGVYRYASVYFIRRETTDTTIFTSSSCNISDEMILCVGASETRISLNIGLEHFSEAYTPHEDGNEAGVGAGAGQLHYNAVSVQKYRDATPGSGACPVCGALCPGGEDPDYRYVVDFGAGGLTDDPSAYCDQIAGEITVRVNTGHTIPICAVSKGISLYESACQWFYYHGTFPYDFSVTLFFESSGANVIARVVVLGSGLGTNTATYESDELDDSADLNIIPNSLPLTLNLVSQSWSVCAGALPDTITLEAV